MQGWKNASQYAALGAAIVLMALNFSTYLEREATAVVAASRRPASIKMPPTFQALHVECESQDIALPDHLNMLRLTSPNCDGENKPSIRNRTNGHTAEIIHLKSMYSTDYIVLEKGSNEIEIRWPDDTTHVVNVQRL